MKEYTRADMEHDARKMREEFKIAPVLLCGPAGVGKSGAARFALNKEPGDSPASEPGMFMPLSGRRAGVDFTVYDGPGWTPGKEIMYADAAFQFLNERPLITVVWYALPASGRSTSIDTALINRLADGHDVCLLPLRAARARAAHIAEILRGDFPGVHVLTPSPHYDDPEWDALADWSFDCWEAFCETVSLFGYTTVCVGGPLLKTAAELEARAMEEQERPIDFFNECVRCERALEETVNALEFQNKTRRGFWKRREGIKNIAPFTAALAGVRRLKDRFASALPPDAANYAGFKVIQSERPSVDEVGSENGVEDFLDWADCCADEIDELLASFDMITLKEMDEELPDDKPTLREHIDAVETCRSAFVENMENAKAIKASCALFKRKREAQEFCERGEWVKTFRDFKWYEGACRRAIAFSDSYLARMRAHLAELRALSA